MKLSTVIKRCMDANIERSYLQARGIAVAAMELLPADQKKYKLREVTAAALIAKACEGNVAAYQELRDIDESAVIQYDFNAIPQEHKEQAGRLKELPPSTLARFMKLRNMAKESPGDVSAQDKSDLFDLTHFVQTGEAIAKTIVV